MAVTPREQKMIDLHEAGASIFQIAEQLGVTPATVQSCIKNLCFNLGENFAFANDCKKGSDKLLTAILRARGAQ